MGKAEKYTAQMFLEMFNRVKSEEKDRKSTTRALVGRTERNFSKLVKAGYLPEEFEKATRQMFRDKEQWAVSTNNDTPEHVLQPQNFERYLNAAENPEKQKEKKDKPKPPPPPKEVVEYSVDEINESRRVYEQSLKEKKWIGTISDAMKIGRSFTDAFTIEEKNGFFAQANSQPPTPTTNRGGGNIADIMNRIAQRYPKNRTLEIAVKEAVKRRIMPPWK